MIRQGDTMSTYLGNTIVTPAIALAEEGRGQELIGSGFVSTLVDMLDCQALRVGLALCVTCLKLLIQTDRKVLSTAGLSKALCDAVLARARGQLTSTDINLDSVVAVLQTMVNYGRTLVAQGEHTRNPFIREILKLDSVKEMRSPDATHLSKPPQFLRFLESIAQQGAKEKTQSMAKQSSRKPEAQLAAEAVEAERNADKLIQEDAREKARMAKKEMKAHKGKGQHSQSATAAAEAGSDLQDDHGDEHPLSTDHESEVEDPDAMLLNSAFGLHARQSGHSNKKTSKQGNQDVVTSASTLGRGRAAAGD
mmetsp:Transcript_11350/g.32924  ORF Transcript_11350/g.32924 Transcript_11350/m.32924 type:complete len:308 (+) Transcript_11350:559-1482(+)